MWKIKTLSSWIFFLAYGPKGFKTVFLQNILKLANGFMNIEIICPEKSQFSLFVTTFPTNCSLVSLMTCPLCSIFVVSEISQFFFLFFCSWLFFFDTIWYQKKFLIFLILVKSCGFYFVFAQSFLSDGLLMLRCYPIAPSNFIAYAENGVNH